jgi:hypothetical protein
MAVLGTVQGVGYCHHTDSINGRHVTLRGMHATKCCNNPLAIAKHSTGGLSKGRYLITRTIVQSQ